MDKIGGGEMSAYEIYAALREEANDGWIWQERYSTRTIITISRKHNGRKLKVFCAVRQFDCNFIRQYNDGAYARNQTEKHMRGQRYEIDNKSISLVMNEWYRKHCLGIAYPTEHRPDGSVSLDITEAKWGFSPGTWFPGIRAACHQPDIAVRLGTRLGVLGGWLGLSGLLFGLIALLHPYLEKELVLIPFDSISFFVLTHPHVEKEATLELSLIAGAVIISVVGAILSIWICQPPKQA